MAMRKNGKELEIQKLLEEQFFNFFFKSKTEVQLKKFKLIY